jgi:hypothetical protein
MELLDNLKLLIDEIEQADELTITAAAGLLESLREKIGVRCLPEATQNNAVMIASATGDKATLRDFAQHSQYADVRAWASEALKPRTTAMSLTL